jgi:hypothetical protein
MAGETSVRQWWLIVKRNGYVDRRIRLNIMLTQEQTQLDPLVGPIQLTKDVDFIDDANVLPAEDQKLVVEYEIISTTQSWEINEIPQE